MPYTAANHLGRLPNAAGTITRLAYAHAKANGIDTQALLKEANLTVQQINNTRLKLRVHDQINFIANLLRGHVRIMSCPSATAASGAATGPALATRSSAAGR